MSFGPQSRAEDLLLEIGLQFGATLDLDRLLPLCLDRLTALFSADRAMFALLEPDGRVQRAVLHNLEWPGPGHPLPVSGTLVRDVVEQGEPVVVVDANTDDRFHVRRSVVALGLRFLAGAPVHDAEGRVTGLLYVDGRGAAATAADRMRRMLSAIARLVGTALENARLFEQQRYRMLLLAAMAHDLRTPLSVIRCNAELQLARGDEAPPDAVGTIDIIACADRMTRMVETALRLSRIDAGASGDPPTRIDPGVTLNEHTRTLEPAANGMGVALRLTIAPDLPPCTTLPDRLWIVLDNLVFNALKHARPASTVHVSARLRDDAGPPDAFDRPPDPAADLFRRAAPMVPTPGTRFVEIAVHTEGRPIDPALRPRLFHLYERGEASARGVPSNGLGLSIVDQCVRSLGGGVWLDPDVQQGARFCFTLPVSARAANPAGDAAAPLGALEPQDTLPSLTEP